MKQGLKRSITLFMAVLVLLSSTGFAFIEHQCMMRGKSMQFLSEKKSDSCKAKVVSSCCAKSKAAKTQAGSFFKKTDCCKENQKFEKVDVVSSQTALLVKLLKAQTGDLFPALTGFKLLYAERVLPDSAISKETISFSSRLHGRSMRSFVQSFLI